MRNLLFLLALAGCSAPSMRDQYVRCMTIVPTPAGCGQPGLWQPCRCFQDDANCTQPWPCRCVKGSPPPCPAVGR